MEQLRNRAHRATGPIGQQGEGRRGRNGPRTARHQRDPWPGHGRGAEGELRPSGDADGARTARARPLHARDAVRRGGAGMARPRPVRALGGPRVDAAVRAALPDRLRAHARRPEAVPAVGLADSGPPGVPPHRRHRGDDGPARSGRRQRRRHRTGRGEPARPVRTRAHRPPRVRDLQRRRLRGGRQPRGRFARGAPRARAPGLRLRRQPHLHRRPDRAGVHGRRPEAVRGVRLARRRARRVRQRPRRAGGRPAGGHAGGREAEPDRPAQPHRLAVAQVHRHGRRPREPARGRRGRRGQGDPGHARRGLLGARRRPRVLPRGRRARGKAAREEWEQRRVAMRTREPALSDEYDACLEQRGLPGWEAKLPSWSAGEQVATRSACSGVLDAILDVVPGSARRRCRPDRQHRYGAQGRAGRGDARVRRPPDPLGHPRARHGFDHERHERQRDAPGRRDVLRVQRLHARRAAARGAVWLQDRVRLVARLRRTRRGRPDPPADRATRLVARDAGVATHPARRRQRDRARAGASTSRGRARPRSS